MEKTKIIAIIVVAIIGLMLILNFLPKAPFDSPIAIVPESKVAIAISDSKIMPAEAKSLIMRQAEKNFAVVQNNDSKSHKISLEYIDIDAVRHPFFNETVEGNSSTQIDVPFKEGRIYHFTCWSCEGDIESDTDIVFLGFSRPERIIEVRYSDNGFISSNIALNSRPSDVFKMREEEHSAKEVDYLLLAYNNSSSKKGFAFLSNTPNDGPELVFQTLPYFTFELQADRSALFLFSPLTKENRKFICYKGCNENSVNEVNIEFR